MKKGKKWIALTGALAVGVMTLIGGSDAKVVQAEISDEEVVEAAEVDAAEADAAEEEILEFLNS